MNTERIAYKLFLDDVREVPMVYPELTNKDFVIARTYSEFVEIIKENGLPYFISFDNDLGEDEKGNLLPDGYAAAQWLVYQSGLDLKKLIFKVHSSKPVAALKIKSLLDNYINFINEN
ncbi:cyclic-phosphate processing receiver domain-containing protein [Flavobacterium sp. ST-75]|uniref:Cyclic-phosphate processing receiver domain-containing protein n=1 Tax=Flavobacterium rhizophilum TaxID=3163296 RepID=A0ABW8YEK2_9FLAO